MNLPSRFAIAGHRFTGISRMLCLALAVLGGLSLCAESKNPADYPLRLHIFTTSGMTFYHRRSVDESKGDGRANLFESSQPRGLDFSFACWGQKIKPSFGFETYPAKWKKPNAELIVLFPVIGKSNAYFTCTLKTELKDYAYFMRNGRLESEPAAQYKAWMVGHDYDPELGKNTPTATAIVVSPSASADTQLQEARQFLTGDHKNTEKARKALLEVAQGIKRTDNPETLVWADIYLGYIDDRAKDRQSAISWYQKALAVEGASPSSLKVARFGVQQPLVWIRHLDAPGQKPPASPYDQ
jgi:hypothetical protein